MPPADQAPWSSRRDLLRHFQRHGPEMGFQEVDKYEDSARGTIRSGRRFTYRDEGSGESRVGYYDLRQGRLTVLTDDEAAIVTHFPCPEHYVRRQPASEYRR